MTTFYGKGSTPSAAQIPYQGPIDAATVGAALDKLEVDKVPKVGGTPNGFIDRYEVDLSWDEGTRTLTLTPAGASFRFYSGGTFYERSAPESAQIDDVEGSWFIYYDESGVLTASNVPSNDLILTWAFVCYVRWDATNKQAIPHPICELHGAQMHPTTHLYLHESVGTRYVRGLKLSDILVDQSGNLDSHAQFSGAGGEIFDEDIEHTILAHLSTTADLRIMYREGANGDWRMSALTSFLALPTGTGRAAWNNADAGGPGIWGLTEVTNNDFVLAHVYAFPGLDCDAGAFMVVMGQADYLTRGNAREGAEVEARNLALDGLPTPEFLLVATLILQTGDGKTNAVKSEVVSTDTGDDYIDWIERLTPRAPL